jgi:hypothetical protein
VCVCVCVCVCACVHACVRVCVCVTVKREKEVWFWVLCLPSDTFGCLLNVLLYRPTEKRERKIKIKIKMDELDGEVRVSCKFV